MARVRLWVKPGSRAESLEWDSWRGRWVVSCQEPPTGGRANRAVANLVAGWLGVPPSSVCWVQSGSARAKVLSVDGITDEEAASRLRSHVPTVQGAARTQG